MTASSRRNGVGPSRHAGASRAPVRSWASVAGVEWPTVSILVLCWLFWAALCLFAHVLHPLVFLVCASLVAGWHASFQHEAIHGHPTRFERVNRALATPSMALWLAFEDYRQSHLAHHVNENLTDPEHDPESYYIWERQWSAMGGWRRRLMSSTNTLFGRLTLGAGLTIAKCLTGQAKRLARGERKAWIIFARHCLASGPPFVVAIVLLDVPLWAYLLGFQFGGAFWMSLRSYLEHEAATGVGRRTAIVFDRLLPPTAWFTGFFSLLFLNNNLHAAHHLSPRLPWYHLPRFVHENRDEILAWNEHNQHPGYGSIARRFAFRSKEPVAHPILRKL